ncbi:alpha/beta hydrolase [Ferrimicrobium sp.]|uniref:alpha/beta fold hydrolase n=1 Tax=Ferrimicrobium sp. TaxID=2926050 RepID=UPI00262ECEA0|nr:alpha/beta hydrolase [Ferrimicrobium sp.]
MNQTLVLHDGRILEYFDSGPTDGAVLIAHHGTPGCGDPNARERQAASQLGVRLIAPSRPGYAGSSRSVGRTIASIAGDVTELLDALEIERCSTYGVSGGGPHALACAALLPDRVNRAASIAGVGPWDQDDLDFLAGMGEDNLVEFGAAANDHAELLTLLTTQRDAMMAAGLSEVPESLSTLLPPVDVTAAKELGNYLVEHFQRALQSGIEGWFDDDLAFTQHWGFDLQSISIPVSIWQGGQDLMVPGAHGRWLDKHIATGELHFEPTEGHLSLPLHKEPAIFTWLVGSDTAQSWRDE